MYTSIIKMACNIIIIQNGACTNNVILIRLVWKISIRRLPFNFQTENLLEKGSKYRAATTTGPNKTPG